MAKSAQEASNGIVYSPTMLNVSPTGFYSIIFGAVTQTGKNHKSYTLI